MLAKKAGKRERAEQHRLQNTLGKVLSAVGKNEGALKAYQAALHLDLTDQETIRGLADVCFKLGDWAGALTNYQKVLTSLRRGGDRGSAPPSTTSSASSSRTRARPSRRSTTSRRRSRSTPAHRRHARRDGRPSTRASRTGSRSATTSGRSSTTSSTAAERYRMLQDIANVWIDKREQPPQGHRGPRGGARSRAAGPQAAPQAARALRQDARSGSGWSTSSSASPTSRCSPSARAATSTRWRSSTATSSRTRCARSTSSTRRSI